MNALIEIKHVSKLRLSDMNFIRVHGFQIFEVHNPRLEFIS